MLYVDDNLNVNQQTVFSSLGANPFFVREQSWLNLPIAAERFTNFFWKFQTSSILPIDAFGVYKKTRFFKFYLQISVQIINIPP